MIDLGEKIAYSAVADLYSANLSKTAAINKFLPVATELLLHRMDVVDKFSTILGQDDGTLAELEGNPQVEDTQNLLAEKFTTNEYPLKPESFGIVPVFKNENLTVVAAVLTTPEGIFLGSSYNEVMSKNRVARAAFRVVVDGQAVDTLDVMDEHVHRAMNTLALAKFIREIREGKKSKDKPLVEWEDVRPEDIPKKNDYKDHKPRSATWLTAYKGSEKEHIIKGHEGLLAPYGFDDDISATSYTRHPDGHWSSVGVRPGVLIRIPTKVEAANE